MSLRSLMLKWLDVFLRLPFGLHLIVGFGIRMLLIIYGNIHDATFFVKYTDVDYRVFTDAARHVWNGESPYERHTYRYSPIIAWLLLPNVFLHESFGKVLFSVADILITICIKSYVFRQQYETTSAATAAKYCSLVWLYNPFSIGISTRGNADSISCLFIILAIYFLQAKRLSRLGDAQYFLSGIFLGVAIHLRLYPIFFAFPMYLSLGVYKINRSTPLRQGLISLIPNRKQIILTVTTIVYFVACTLGMYLIYGYKFIFETYIYHLFRNDTRHNFSLFFYHSYLRMGDVSFDLIKFTGVVFVFVILLLLSLSFGTDPQTLPFSLFCNACILVMYNTVVTSQYFIWYLSLLPLILHNIKTSMSRGSFFFFMWAASQATWLFYAYLLEFLNQDTYIIIWATGVFFYISNVLVLFSLISHYSPLHTFNIPDRAFVAKSK